MDDSQRREILEQIDEITKQIWEGHHEKTRQQIDQLYEELYRRIKELRDDDATESKSYPKADRCAPRPDHDYQFGIPQNAAMT